MRSGPHNIIQESERNNSYNFQLHVSTVSIRYFQSFHLLWLIPKASAS
uniref:Uncharacterized protein n=1 Tax=Arundo donax TaxID=35708 RepID=A0A0A8Y6D0_ARUDO